MSIKCYHCGSVIASNGGHTDLCPQCGGSLADASGHVINEHHVLDEPKAMPMDLATEDQGPLEADLFATLPSDAVTIAPIGDVDPFSVAVQHGELAAEQGSTESPLRPSSIAINSATGLQRTTNEVLAVLAVLGMIIGCVYFAAGDAILERWQDTAAPPLQSLNGVQLLSMRSVRYPNTTHGEIVVVFGEAKNNSKHPQSNLDVVAELTDQKGKVLAFAKAPVGLPLSPHVMMGLTDNASVQEAYGARFAAKGPFIIKPGAVAAFTAILTNPPQHLERLTHGARLVIGTPKVAPNMAAQNMQLETKPKAVEINHKQRTKKRHDRRKRKGKRKKRRRKNK